IVMDRIGGHLGLVECAVDHMKSDEKIVVAQRKRAWDQVGDKNVGDYAPAPSLLWWLPVVSVVVVAIQSQVTRTQMIEGASNEAQVGVIVPQPNKVKQAEKEPSLKRRAKTKPRIGSDVIRKTVAKPVDSPQSPKRKEAQAGQKVGAVSGGETGIKFVAIESQKAATTLKIEGSSQTLRSSGKIDGRIVEPARPFPPQYHQVIETWFRRQKE
ncbi:MAG: hypothetical protein VYA30_15815, partial [Myxococcota bacterium]|nr:hypothetical protein [Myxococcota bacterium]